jgi:predicted DNA-binding protein
MDQIEKTVPYSFRAPDSLIRRAIKLGDNMRGGTSAAIRQALDLGLAKMESKTFAKSSMTQHCKK